MFVLKRTFKEVCFHFNFTFQHFFVMKQKIKQNIPWKTETYAYPQRKLYNDDELEHVNQLFLKYVMMYKSLTFFYKNSGLQPRIFSNQKISTSNNAGVIKKVLNISLQVTLMI